MSRLLLVMTAVSSVAVPYGPVLPPAGVKTPLQRLNVQYEERYAPHRPAPPCRRRTGEDIVVCAEAGGMSPYRLPLPQERHAAGDRVSHVSEPPGASLTTSFCHRVGCAEPSKLGETIGKIITALKGEDPH